MVGTNSRGNKIKRMPWSHSPHWQEIIDEQMNDELLFSTLNQSSAKVHSVILRSNEVDMEKRQLHQQLVEKSVNIFNQLKGEKKKKPMVGITRIPFPKTDANWLNDKTTALNL